VIGRIRIEDREVEDADADHEDASGAVDPQQRPIRESPAHGMHRQNDEGPPERGPEQDTRDQLDGQNRIPPDSAHVNRREDRREGDEGHRVGQRQGEGREEVPREAAVVRLSPPGDGSQQ